MKLLENLVKGTSCYKDIVRELGVCTKEYETLERVCKEQDAILLKKTKQLEKDKTTARQIVRLTNKTFQDKETKNQIKQLCNKIIKGEK